MCHRGDIESGNACGHERDARASGGQIRSSADRKTIKRFGPVSQKIGPNRFLLSYPNRLLVNCTLIPNWKSLMVRKISLRVTCSILVRLFRSR